MSDDHVADAALPEPQGIGVTMASSDPNHDLLMSLELADTFFDEVVNCTILQRHLECTSLRLTKHSSPMSL